MNIALSLFIAIAGGYLLIIGKFLLVPLVIAVFVWFLIKALAGSLNKVLPKPMPWLTHSVAAIILLVIMLSPIQLVAGMVPNVLEVLPRYEANVYSMLGHILDQLPIEKEQLIDDAKANVNVTAIISAFANNITGFTSNFFLVLVYVAFLFAEQGVMKQKILKLPSCDEQRQHLEDIIVHLNKRVTTYVWVKTQLSALTAILSYFVMLGVGLDFAAFWALFIFVLNFIPSFGSVISTLFPVLLAIIQFHSVEYALITLVGIGVVQFSIGNVLEPRLMGKSLNLSPFFILVSLILWGSIWGVTGLFLSVPLTVVMMIIFVEFKTTRPYAILLSSDGNISLNNTNPK